MWSHDETRPAGPGCFRPREGPRCLKSFQCSPPCSRLTTPLQTSAGCLTSCLCDPHLSSLQPLMQGSPCVCPGMCLNLTRPLHSLALEVWMLFREPVHVCLSMSVFVCLCLWMCISVGYYFLVFPHKDHFLAWGDESMSACKKDQSFDKQTHLLSLIVGLLVAGMFYWMKRKGCLWWRMLRH